MWSHAYMQSNAAAKQAVKRRGSFAGPLNDLSLRYECGAE